MVVKRIDFIEVCLVSDFEKGFHDAKGPYEKRNYEKRNYEKCDYQKRK
jgi:hypothetical protein